MACIISSKTNTKNILIAPLNWGLGHATRCIPIINELLKEGFNPIIASDGAALLLLQKEFPSLKSVELPSYNIKYPKNGKLLKWKLLSSILAIGIAVKGENKIVNSLIESENLVGIISDNRLGVRSGKVPSVYITHQIKVLVSPITFFTSRIHQFYINKFNECWIPDTSSKIRLAGELSNSKEVSNSIFIGVLSRFKKAMVEKKYDLLVLLSGIEPLRSQLEEKLLRELKDYNGSILFIQGKISDKITVSQNENVTMYNYLLSEELESVINQSKLVLTRSGYSTIMDLAKLNKKAFFIPTTGQDEQEYLAKHLKNLKVAPFSTATDFKIEMLNEIKNYSGFTKKYNSELAMDLFNLFHSK